MAKRILVAVISDLVTDQRVHKVCNTLHEAGFEVLLTGARKKGSLGLAARPYPARRIRMLFQGKAFFYMEFNIRLFARLLFSRGDYFLGNDLDVMPAVWLAGWIRRRPVVYDTHEYWMGMPEMKGRNFVINTWKRIEGFIFPRLTYIYTICDSFCELYRKDYGKELRTVRNLPYLNLPHPPPLPAEIETALPRDKFFLLFQGAGINPERGVEELVQAMQFLDPSRYHLVIIGGGTIFQEVRSMVAENRWTDRITIISKIPFETLRMVTRRAHLGLSLDKPTNINHIYGLPNKIFDYLHCGVPVLVSRLVELEKVVNKYDVGAFIDSHEPSHIAARIGEIFNDPERMKHWISNTEKVRQELNWENEGRIVLDIFEQVALENS